jgi:hypothetical protein
LLYYLPNLQYLELVYSDLYHLPETILWEWLHVDRFVEGSCVPICLSKITTFLRFRTARDASESEYGLDASAFMSAILCLPRLQCTKLYESCFDSDKTLVDGPFGGQGKKRNADGDLLHGGDLVSYPKFPTSLEILDLDLCNFDAETLKVIFERSPKLRIVNLIVAPGGRFGDTELNMEDNPHVIDEFADAFEHLRDSLEELKIVPSFYHEECHDCHFLAGPTDSCGWIGDLSGYPKLRKFETDWHFWSLPDEIDLVDGRPAQSADFLPERLEYLKITTEKYLKPYGGTALADFEGPYEKSRDSGKLPTFKKSTYLRFPTSRS